MKNDQWMPMMWWTTLDHPRPRNGKGPFLLPFAYSAPVHLTVTVTNGRNSTTYDWVALGGGAKASGVATSLEDAKQQAFKMGRYLLRESQK